MGVVPPSGRNQVMGRAADILYILSKCTCMYICSCIHVSCIMYNIQGVPKKCPIAIFSFNLFNYICPIILFHMCFEIRILSPFHLNTLNIPIQNINCPTKHQNAWADIILSPAIICEAWTVSKIYNWNNWLITRIFGSLFGPYFNDRLQW